MTYETLLVIGNHHFLQKNKEESISENIGSLLRTHYNFIIQLSLHNAVLMVTNSITGKHRQV